MRRWPDCEPDVLDAIWQERLTASGIERLAADQETKVAIAASRTIRRAKEANGGTRR